MTGRTRAGLLAALSLLLAACGTMLAPQRPEIKVVGVELRDIRLAEQQFVLDLNVTNPNSFGVSLSGVRFDVDVADRDFAQGVTTGPITLPAGGTSPVSVLTATTTRNLVDQVASLVANRSLDYRIAGRAYVTSPLPITIPFSHEGKVDLSTIDLGAELGRVLRR